MQHLVQNRKGMELNDPLAMTRANEMLMKATGWTRAACGC